MVLTTIINELEISKRTLFFSVIGQTYYFLIAFFLFNPDSINQLDELFLIDINFFLILSASLVMSLIWFVMNVSISVILLLLSYTNHRDSNPSEIFINAMICSIGFLTGAMLLNYALEYDFKHFIAYAFTFIAVRILWCVIKYLIVKNRSLVIPNNCIFFTLK